MKNYRTVFSWFFFTFFLLFSSPHQIFATDYYVSESGSDTNTGKSVTSPWKNLTKAKSSVAAGDTVHIANGTYILSSALKFSTSGTATSPITIIGESRDGVKIQAASSSVPPGDWDGFIVLSGSYNIIKNLTVSGSNGYGILITGAHSEAINIYSHHHGEAGILLQGDYSVADGCEIYYNTTHNEFGKQRAAGIGYWGTGISICRWPVHATIRNCKSYNNWGEGISAFATANSTIENNVAYDNWSVNMYIQNTYDSRITGNLIYRNPNNIFTLPNMQAWGSETGLVESNEDYDTLGQSGKVWAISHNNLIANNIVVGANGNFNHWGNAMDGSIITNNIFMNSQSSKRPNVQITDAGTNVYFVNNLIIQDSTAVGAATSITSSVKQLTNKTFTSIAAAQIAAKGTYTTREGAATYFAPVAGSGLINAGTNIYAGKATYLATILSEYHPFAGVDFTAKTRDSSYDIGAIEYGGLTPSASPAAKIGDASGDGRVDLIDYSIWLNFYNQTVSGGRPQGDFNTSGKVDLIDYSLWLNNYNT